MKPLAQDAEDPLGVAIVRERHNSIVGKPDKGAYGARPGGAAKRCGK
jgi:hypothetical protein